MSKRILFCIPGHSAFLEPILKALKVLDFDVRVFDYQRGDSTTRFISTMNNFLHRNNSIELKRNEWLQNQLLTLSKKWRPELLLVIKGERISPSTLNAITQLGIKTINWYPDWLEAWPWIKEHAPFYSLFICCCYDTYTRLKKIYRSTLYLPYASDPDQELSYKEKMYPISFVGQYSPRRERYFKEIADAGLTIWGYKKWKASSLRHISHSPVSPKKTLEIFRRSKIVVNILTGDDSFQPKAVNNRTFEASGVGAFLLVQENPILWKHFRRGKDLVTFTSPQDLKRKAIYYLQHDQEREKISRNGWQWVKRHHTYQQRLKDIFKYIS